MGLQARSLLLLSSLCAPAREGRTGRPHRRPHAARRLFSYSQAAKKAVFGAPGRLSRRSVDLDLGVEGLSPALGVEIKKKEWIFRFSPAGLTMHGDKGNGRKLGSQGREVAWRSSRAPSVHAQRPPWRRTAEGALGRPAVHSRKKHLCPSSCGKPAASTSGSGRRKHWAHSSRVNFVFCSMGFVYSFVRPSRTPCSVHAGCCSEHWA